MPLIALGREEVRDNILILAGGSVQQFNKKWIFF